jgi:predicted Zn-dependent protease
VSEAQEIRAGQRAAREASRTLGLVADQELQDYVQRVGARIAAESDRAQLPWTFRVVDDAMPNAFGMPGGYVFVTRGLLGVLDSEAELAAVIAHEIAHVAARHGVQALARQSGAEIGVWAVPISGLRSLDAGSGLGAGLLFREHEAEAERQADDLAFRYALAAGYDVREMADVFAALGRVEIIGGRSALPPWLTTHRDPGQRAETMAQRARAVTEGDSLQQHRVEYLEQIEDLAYGQDPRQAVIRGSTFLHPDLRFRIDLPSGWRLRNLTQALVATSPDQDAAIQLTIVEQVAPGAAAERFVAQSGIDATGSVTEDVVNERLAVTVPFRVTTGAGTAEGVAAWVSYGGRTYQIVGVTTNQDANGHAAAVRSAVRTFNAVSDTRLADLRPSRINIVRLGRATTFDEFNRRYPSVVDAEEIALLNRVAGGSSRLRAGGRMKRVVKG